MEYVIETVELSKVFNTTVAVKKVNLHIPKGSIYGLVGKNGAGKTTILKILAGLAKPSRGTFTILGETVVDNRQIFKNVSALIENPGLMKDLNASDNLKIKALALGLNLTDNDIDKRLADVGLLKAKARFAKTYSLGMKQRLGIAIALLGDPQILLFDEPINALDPQGIMEIRELLVNLKDKGHTIVVSSHILDELSKIATHYAFIDRGEIKLESSAAELQHVNKDITIVATNDNEKTVLVLREKGFTALLRDGKVRIENYPGKQSTIYSMLEQANIEVYSISQESDSLERLFVEITQGGEGYNG